MSHQDSNGLSGLSFAELFALETATQVEAMTEGLLALESRPTDAGLLESVMRAAHSLKGAARVVGRDAAVRLTHVMEDCFVAAQNGEIQLTPERIDVLLLGADLLTRLSGAREEDMDAWDAEHAAEIDGFVRRISPSGSGELATQFNAEPIETDPTPVRNLPELFAIEAEAGTPAPPVPAPLSGDLPRAESDGSDRSLRITADNLNRLMGLAGELVVASRWSAGSRAELLRLKKSQAELNRSIENLRSGLVATSLSVRQRAAMDEIGERALRCNHLVAERIEDNDSFDRGFTNLTSRLYDEVLQCRMRPFGDGVAGLRRMVRDVARSLGKEVQLNIDGESTAVDRDILERIDAPLGHLLRNAVDHGIENKALRLAAGKPERAVIRLEARHSAGMLIVSVADDGRGIDVESVRAAIVAKNLASADSALTMSETELLEFLFLPGFTLKHEVTEISGRGVGLDVVAAMVREVGGTVRVVSEAGSGTEFQLQLPLTLSVMRTLLVEINAEPFAFPLTRIVRALRVPRNQISTLQGRHHFAFGGQQLGLVSAREVLELSGSDLADEELNVLVIGDKNSSYGLVVDRFLKEQELVVRPLDARLGKVRDISAAALLPDRTAVLIIDAEDVVRSIEKLIGENRGFGDATRAPAADVSDTSTTVRRVLVVDDSLTVRELERKLLQGRGYQVEVAVDGADGWNAVRAGNFDLVITDVDMPRMDGIELVKLLKNDARLNGLPVMIVSYKDREEDRRRGLDAGADYYLTKSSFHDDSLIGAVVDLIGEATS